jgi:membrane protein implicated in regulation of membrane protease activity
MTMESLLAGLGPWVWWILAGLFLIIELLAPGVFFVWLALAASVVGAISFVHDFIWQIDIALFAALSLVFVIVVRPWYAQRNAVSSDRPNLNQRIYDYVGRTYVLDEAITNGTGKIRIDDTLWDALGPDIAKGTRVKVIGVEGLRLRVEPA